MLARFTLVLLATGLVSIGPGFAQSGNPFKGRIVGDFDVRPKGSVHILDDGPAKGDFRSAPDIAPPAKGSSKPEPIQFPAAPVSALSEAAHKAKLKSSLSPKLIKKLDSDARVGDFESTRKTQYQGFFGKPMTAAPMTAAPMTMRRVPQRLNANPLGGKPLIYTKPSKGGRFSSP